MLVHQRVTIWSPSHHPTMGFSADSVESHLIPRTRLLLHRFGADEGLQDGRDQPGNVLDNVAWNVVHGVFPRCCLVSKNHMAIIMYIYAYENAYAYIIYTMSLQSIHVYVSKIYTKHHRRCPKWLAIGVPHEPLETPLGNNLSLSSVTRPP